jgi:hypothetical protein
MVIETSASAAVPWTKPQDLQFDPNNPHQGVGDGFPGGFVAGFCDGSTFFIEDNVSASELKAKFTRASGD